MVRGSAAEGRNPAAERKQAREEFQSEWTFANLEREYMERHAEPNKRERSVAYDRAHLKNHVPDSWRSRRVSEFTRPQIIRLHDDLRRESGIYAANQTVRLLRCMFNLAHDWDAED